MLNHIHSGRDGIPVSIYLAFISLLNEEEEGGGANADKGRNKINRYVSFSCRMRVFILFYN